MGSAITESLFLLGAGVLLGAGIGLVLAPKTGAEMRRDLARRFKLDKSDVSAEKVGQDAEPPGAITQIAP
jgi:gas vesicle protein